MLLKESVEIADQRAHGAAPSGDYNVHVPIQARRLSLRPRFEHVDHYPFEVLARADGLGAQVLCESPTKIEGKHESNVIRGSAGFRSAGDGELGGLFGIKAGTTGSPWRTCQRKVGLVYVCTVG